MSKKQDELAKKALFYIEETGMLMQMPRLHKRLLGNTFDTVSSHSHHTGVIAFCIANLEGLSETDCLRAMAMAVFHDIPEARTGDLDLPAKQYSKTDEQKAVNDQLKNLPGGKYLEKIYKEWYAQKTKVSKCVKDADALEQRFQEWVLMYQGNKLAQKWYEGGSTYRVPFYRTESAKRLASLMEQSDPNDWWYSEFVEKGVNQKHLNDIEVEPEG